MYDKESTDLKKLPILGISYSMFEILCGPHVFCFVFPSLNRVSVYKNDRNWGQLGLS